MNRINWPTPTPARVALAQGIFAHSVRHYHWTDPVSRHTGTDRVVTRDVDRFVRAGLAVIPAPPVPGGWSTVQLTDEGHQWLKQATT